MNQSGEFFPTESKVSRYDWLPTYSPKTIGLVEWFSEIVKSFIK